MAEFRALGRDDAPAWAAMRRTLWPEADPAELAAEITSLLGRPDCLNLGAFDDALVGLAEASIRPFGDGCDTAPVAWLEGIYVAPSHRGQGIGGRLVRQAEAWARDRGLSELGSDAVIGNEDSIAAHLHWGFEETERVVMFRKKL